MFTKQPLGGSFEKCSHGAVEKDASDIVSKSYATSHEVRSDSKKQASVSSQCSQDATGIGTDLTEQHCYYQVCFYHARHFCDNSSIDDSLFNCFPFIMYLYFCLHLNCNLLGILTSNPELSIYSIKVFKHGCLLQ